MNLDLDESHHKIAPSEFCNPGSQNSCDPEILSSLGDYPHFPRPTDILFDTPRNFRVCFYPPYEGLVENERLYLIVEEDYICHHSKPPTLTTPIIETQEYPKTLMESWNDPHYANRIIHVEPEYTIFRVVHKVSSIDACCNEKEHYVGTLLIRRED